MQLSRETVRALALGVVMVSLAACGGGGSSGETASCVAHVSGAISGTTSCNVSAYYTSESTGTVTFTLAGGTTGIASSTGSMNFSGAPSVTTYSQADAGADSLWLLYRTDLSAWTAQSKNAYQDLIGTFTITLTTSAGAGKKDPVFTSSEAFTVHGTAHAVLVPASSHANDGNVLVDLTF